MIRFIINLIQALIGLILSLLFASCQYKIDVDDVFSSIEGSEKITTENRQLSGFIEIKVSQAIQVELIQANIFEVFVEANDNIMPHLKTEVSSGELKIYYDKTFKSFKNVDAKVKIKMPFLNKINASSASTVTSNEGFTGKNLQINTSSAASVKLYVEYDDIAADASSASSVSLKGMSLSSQFKASSAATIQAKDLKSNNVSAKSSSAGVIRVWPILKLDAKASSGGIIYYFNDPTDNLIKKSSSGGSVSKQ